MKHKVVRWIKIITLILAISGLSWLFFEGKLFLKTNALFEIENISFEETDLLAHPQIQTILESNLNLNIFGLNISNLKKRLEEIPQASQVIVQRSFPNIIRVTIEEREPVCLLKGRDSFWQVDKKGFVFLPLEGKFSWNLPVITGLKEENLIKYRKERNVSPEIRLALEIKERFEEKNFNLPLELSEIHFGRLDEIVIYTFTPRLELRLSRERFKEEFENLDLVLADLDKKGLEAQSVDLRFLDKVFVHLKG